MDIAPGSTDDVSKDALSLSLSTRTHSLSSSFPHSLSLSLSLSSRWGAQGSHSLSSSSPGHGGQVTPSGLLAPHLLWGIREE